jgi:murein DD-endopeptidase MepM/ murein hydrolase activator NlpD
MHKAFFHRGDREEKYFSFRRINFHRGATINSTSKNGKEEKMDKKFKFSDQPRKVKIIYSAVIGVLCLTAIAVGIVSSSNKNSALPDDEPTANLPEDEGVSTPPEDEKGENETPPEEEKKPEKVFFHAPVVGKVTKGHSIDTPVFSDTLQEWRVHTGIDISAEEGAQVYASADGVVSRVYTDPFLGKTVEITHDGGIVSVYSNLSVSAETAKVGEAVKAGALIGVVGDSSLSELADESHLHFAIKVGGVSVNPLDYISEDSKKASLGILTA